MHKRIIGQKQAPSASSEQGWLNVEGLVEVEITSEDATHPIESALRPGETSGWRAAEAGEANDPAALQPPATAPADLDEFCGARN